MDWTPIDAWAKRKGIGYKTRHSWRARGIPHKYRPAIVAATGGVVTMRAMERAAKAGQLESAKRALMRVPAVARAFQRAEDEAWDRARAKAEIAKG